MPLKVLRGKLHSSVKGREKAISDVISLSVEIEEVKIIISFINSVIQLLERASLVQYMV